MALLGRYRPLQTKSPDEGAFCGLRLMLDSREAFRHARQCLVDGCCKLLCTRPKTPCQVSRSPLVSRGPLLWPPGRKTGMPLENKGRADPAYWGVEYMTPADTGEHLSRTVVWRLMPRDEIRAWRLANDIRHLVGSVFSLVPTAHSLRAWCRVGWHELKKDNHRETNHDQTNSVFTR